MSLDTSFGLSTIGQIAIPVKDLERAVTFYRDSLGMRFLFKVPRLAFFDCAGVRLMLDIPETEEFQKHSSIIYFMVADLAAAHRTLLERGVTFRTDPHIAAKMADREVWMAFLLDTEGNTLALMNEILTP